MLLELLLILWIACAVLITFQQRTYRIIIYFAVFSLISSLLYLLVGAPDVAMAEAGISAFTTIFFIICIEKYYNRKGSISTERPPSSRRGAWVFKLVMAIVFTTGLFALFVHFMPNADSSTYLKDQFLLGFMNDVGGENTVASILLGYRVYDTLFEALILVIAVAAVTHMSWSSKASVADGRHSELENYQVAIFTVRIICPIILLFGVYLILNGHISAGGGFQGGLAIASFFICRYYVYGIYDIPVKKVIKLEELIFINIVIVAVIAVFLGTVAYLPIEHNAIFQDLYLIAMNVLIGLKVACGFFILFYRYIAIERM